MAKKPPEFPDDYPGSPLSDDQLLKVLEGDHSERIMEALRGRPAETSDQQAAKHAAIHKAQTRECLPETLQANGKAAENDSVISEMHRQSMQVNFLATKLSEKIIAFEKWLDELPGRVEAEYVIGGLGDEYREAGLILALRRSGKQWAILSSYVESDDEEAQLKPLAEADLDTKLLAVKHFPDLLRAITEVQRRRLEELKAGHDQFDEFAKSIGMKIEKEGT